MSALSRRDRRALWIGALIVGPVLAWRGLAAPYASWLDAQDARAVAAAEGADFAALLAFGIGRRHAREDVQDTIAVEVPEVVFLTILICSPHLQHPLAECRRFALLQALEEMADARARLAGGDEG